MSEYLSKKAALDAIETEQLRLMGEHQSVTGYHKRYVTGKYDGLNWVKHQIQSGAFDADQTEVQRLRDVLEMAQSELRWGDPANAIERVERIIDEALSTTTEPTDAAKVKRVREYYRKLEELRNRTKYRDAAIEYEQRITDICNVLDFLGITIAGINAPETEKEGRTG